MSSFLLEQPALAEEEVIPVPVESIPAEVVDHVVRGTSTLGAAVFIERGATFLANVLAVRLAGPATFGAYSLGITTANNISTYAAGGIGTTATRFSGKYPYEGGSYQVFAQVMATISLASCALAAIALSLGAGPIARVLHKPELVGLLQWAGITAAGMVLLECMRGFLVGQRRLRALAVLSLLVGFGMLVAVPSMAHTHQPVAMVISHGAVTLSAVAICCLFASRLSLLAPANAAQGVAFMPMLREVWKYGLIQLSGLVSANVAGWWVTALVARGDTTLVQVSFFAIASQLRNLIGLLPALLTEGSFAAMATPDEESSVPHRVMLLCTYASTAVSFLIAGLTATVAPLLLRVVYGEKYSAAALVVCTAVAVAVVQMGNAPPSARLSVVSIRATAMVNTTWAIFTALIGTLWMFHGGSAAQAMGVFLAAHVVIAGLVLVGLHRRDAIPAGLVELFVASTVGVLLLCLLAAYRAHHPAQSVATTSAMFLVTIAVLAWMFDLGRRNSALPSKAMVQALAGRVSAPLVRRFSARAGGR